MYLILLPAGASVGNVQNIMGVLYSCTTFLGMFNMMGVMPILGYERSVMYRYSLCANSFTTAAAFDLSCPTPIHVCVLCVHNGCLQ